MIAFVAKRSPVSRVGSPPSTNCAGPDTVEHEDDDLDIGVHGAFIHRLEPGVLVVAPVLSVAPDVLYPEEIRVPYPPVSYSSRDTPPELGIWCELHVDCQAARVHDTPSELVAEHTLYGRDVEIAGVAADCALMTLHRTTRKPPPPPPRKRRRRR